MLKKYLGDIAFMQVINLLVKSFWILKIDVAVQNALPLEVYGNYAALLSFSLMFFIILDLGLNSYNTTQVARDNEKIVSLTSSILGIKILLMAIYVVVGYLVGSLLGYTSEEFGMLLFLWLLQFITSINQFLRSIVSSLQKFKWDGIFMVLDRVLVVTIVGILLWGGLAGWEITIQRFVYAQLAGVGLVFISLVVFLRKYLVHVRISFNVSSILPILQKSWPFALLIALMGMFNYTDAVMLKYLVGDTEAGVYAMAYKLSFALFMFGSVFSGVLLPFFSKNIEDLRIIEQIGSYTSKFLLLVGISTGLICLAYNVEIMEMLYPNKATAGTKQAFSILMFGFIGSALVLVFGTLLTAALELKALNIAAFITLAMNLVLNTQLIPIYGASGAAAATLSSQLLFGSICYILSMQKFMFSTSAKELIKQIFGVILLISTIVFLKQYTKDLYVHFIMIAVTILLGAYLFKLYRVKDLKSLLKK